MPAGCDGTLAVTSPTNQEPCPDQLVQSEPTQLPLVTRCQCAASPCPYVCVKIFRSQAESPETDPGSWIPHEEPDHVQPLSRHSQSVRASYLRVRAVRVLSALSGVMSRLTGNDYDV